MLKSNLKGLIVLAIVSLTMFAFPAFAQDAGGVATKVTGQFEAFGQAVLGAMFPCWYRYCWIVSP
jgi:hypothetical protein